MQLRPPLSLKAFAIGAWVLLALIVVPIVLRVAQAMMRAQPVAELMLLPMLIMILWAGWTWAAAMWRASSWRLIADDSGITLRYRCEATKILWEQVALCREEASPQERDGSSWVTLRGEHDEVLLMWERSWFGNSKVSLHRFDQFTEFVRRQIAL